MPFVASSHDSLSLHLMTLHQQAIVNYHRRLLVLTGSPDWINSALQCLPAALTEQPGLWVNSEGGACQSTDSTSDVVNSVAANANVIPSHLVAAKQCRQILGLQFGWVVFDGTEGIDPDALGASSGTLAGGGLFVLLLAPTPKGTQSVFERWFGQQLSRAENTLRVTESYGQNDSEFTLDRGSSTAPVEPEAHLPSRAPVSAPIVSTPSVMPLSDPDCLTEDQALAVAKLLRVVEGHRRRPLVISADRGRGKSAALGIAAARLMQQRRILIRVTAPSISAVEPLFERLAVLLPQSQRRGNRVELGESLLEFVALDLLLQQCPSTSDETVPATSTNTDRSRNCGLLLVDEAAAIPAPMLERLLRHHSRIAFATTTHGYEGSGRGFQLRFRQTLERLTPNWSQCELRSPIRWRAGDPLERWVFDALLLDAELFDAQLLDSELPDGERLGAEPGVASDSDIGKKTQRQAAKSTIAIDRSALHFRCWSPQQLIDNPRQLKQLFALLVQAHYRTKPSDLRDLLDNPAMRVWLLHQRVQQPVHQSMQQQEQQQESLVGVLWVAHEGGFDAEMARSVWLGQRRPRGHLLPQVLTAQAGWRQAARLNYWRIVRVAVPEPLRRQGFGAELIQRLIDQAQRDSAVDIVATSFGATADLLPFWSGQRLQPLRLGIKADASSGCVSLVYGLGCSEAGQVLVELITRRFADDLPQQLQSGNRELEPELITALLRQVPLGAQVSQQDWLDLYSFAFGQRQLQQVEAALCRWILWRLSNRPSQNVQTRSAPVGDDPVINELVTNSLPVTLQTLLVRRFLQSHPWSDLLPSMGLSGPRQAEQWLRQQLSEQFDGCAELVDLGLLDAL
ncbi:MAG: GNAT family N-acetyltransferase [Motiliproteus sp.]